jgi:Fic family protein
MREQTATFRAGRYIRQPEGYRAFIPAPLPPAPGIQMDAELVRLLSDADRALGRLDGVTTVLPNPDLFVAMYVRQEAVLSSQIEGTQSTLEDVLEFELEGESPDQPKDVEEVVNYVRAMNHGLARLQDLPLCLRLIREIHGILLQGVRGSERTPGDFRTKQNWIGVPGCALAQAAFVPPPIHEMTQSLGDLEQFLHRTDDLPVLIHCGLAHAQFETIHPFGDGNGRVGRLLITFLLCQQRILTRPLLYLSHYLKAHRAEYYDRLMGIRNDGNWEGWLKFFLRGVGEVSRAAANTAREILQMREQHRQIVLDQGHRHGPLLLDLLFERPLLTTRTAEHHLGCSFATAARLMESFVQADLLKETTGKQRNRRYRYDPYLRLFEPSLAPADEDTDTLDIQSTEAAT